MHLLTMRAPGPGVAPAATCVPKVPATTHCRRQTGAPDSAPASARGSVCTLTVGAALLTRFSQRRSVRKELHRGGQRASTDAQLVDQVKADDTKAVDPARVSYIQGIFADVLEVKVPSRLETFLEVLQGTGHEILGKGDWKAIGGDLHPFILPVATKRVGDSIVVVGLCIRGANGSPLQPDEYLVVSQRVQETKQVQLLATDMWKYIMMCSEVAVFRNEKQDLPVIEATRDVYNVRFKGDERTALDKWLLLEVGPFPSVYANLAEDYLSKGDVASTSVVIDTMREEFGMSWGFPHLYQCKVYGQFGDRALEARDAARRCLTGGVPLWSLEVADKPIGADALQGVILEAQLTQQKDLNDLKVFYLRRSTDDQRAAVRTGNTSAGCATLAKAQALLDAVCCGHMSYESVRPTVRDMYDEVPGCEPLVALIEYFMK